MDFEGILSTATFIVFLVLVPASATLIYFILLLHQSIRNQERYVELIKREGRREERLRRTVEKKRLADPFFHFNITHGKGVDEMVQEQLNAERAASDGKNGNGKNGRNGNGKNGHATAKVPKRDEVKDRKILKAIEEGRLILLDTELDNCAPGMVVGRDIEAAGLIRGDELTPETMGKLRGAGVASVPVLYNPSRVAGALASQAA